MTNEVNKEKQKIIKHLKKVFSKRFRVIDNTGEDKKLVAGQFPDIILMRPEPPPNSDVIFIMKIETKDDNDFVDSIAEWKELGTAPSVFYIVVPEKSLDKAKKLVSATGIRARLGSYKMDQDEVEHVRFE